jgi:hypothetical protein
MVGICLRAEYAVRIAVAYWLGPAAAGWEDEARALHLNAMQLSHVCQAGREHVRLTIRPPSFSTGWLVSRSDGKINNNGMALLFYLEVPIIRNSGKTKLPRYACGATCTPQRSGF